MTDKMGKYLIVLSGGGFAQIESSLGCLKALGEEIDIYSNNVDWRGTSAGAIVASCLQVATVSGMVDMIRENPRDDLIEKRWCWWARMLWGQSIYERDGLEQVLKNIVDEQIFHRVRIVITDTRDWSRKEVNAHYEAILASSSIKRIFPLIKISGVKYADGGYTDNVPVEPWRVNEYDRVFLILLPRDPNSVRHKGNLIGRLLSEFDVKMSQEVNEAEHVYSQKKHYPNVTVLRPPPIEYSLLNWSEDLKLFKHAYGHSRSVLNL